MTINGATLLCLLKIPPDFFGESTSEFPVPCFPGDFFFDDFLLFFLNASGLIACRPSSFSTSNSELSRILSIIELFPYSAYPSLSLNKVLLYFGS